jgi:hypothetical protein
MYRRSQAGQRERCWRRACCAAKERLGVRRLSVSFRSLFQVRRQELHARDCILQPPHTVSNQVLTDHYEERNIKFFTYVRPYHAHLDDTGDLARLRVRGHATSVEEVQLATQSGICGSDVHIHHPFSILVGHETTSATPDVWKDMKTVQGRRLRGRGRRSPATTSVGCV